MRHLKQFREKLVESIQHRVPPKRVVVRDGKVVIYSNTFDGLTVWGEDLWNEIKASLHDASEYDTLTFDEFEQQPNARIYYNDDHELIHVHEPDEIIYYNDEYDLTVTIETVV